MTQESCIHQNSRIEEECMCAISIPELGVIVRAEYDLLHSKNPFPRQFLITIRHPVSANRIPQW
jgi:hypothetical protein